MEWSRYTASLTADAARIAEVADGNTGAHVPSCPDWTVDDLLDHVAMVYQHKIRCIRDGEAPKPWPPEEVVSPPLTRLRVALGDLLAEFTAREPGSPAYTWYGPDQTVGFWMRRMAQETAVHRVDAELAAGVEPTEVPGDIAVDGIDELLRIFMEADQHGHPEEWTETLAGATGTTVSIRTGGRVFAVTVAPERISVADAEPSGGADCTVTGDPHDVLLWLWRRLPADRLAIAGDAAEADRLHRILEACTQ